MIFAFESWTDFLLMGGYAEYVWSAVGVTLLVLAGQLVYALKQNAKIKRSIVTRTKEFDEKNGDNK